MIDWKKTLAFSPTPSSNAIFVKKDNGSGAGVKEDDYLPFVLKLQSELLAFRDPGDERADRSWRRSEQIARNEFRRTLPGYHGAPARRRICFHPQVE